MTRSSNDSPAASQRTAEAVRAYALTFPEAWEDFPWGHSAFKVRKKIFVTLGLHQDGVSMSFKLPRSNHEALLMPFTEPTHYGMGKHGWVTATFAPAETPPMFLLKEWIEESYRAIAPKTLVARLDEPEARPAAKQKQAAPAPKQQAAPQAAARRTPASSKRAKKR
jgi:predicted DNA-binding protein (MmcQ/YjbR family)